ncbi:MAG: DUF4153 domain-containing protein [Patescibacteria group bacterium]
MTTDLNNQPASQNRSSYMEILVISLLLTAVFHFLPADHPTGIAFAIFVLALSLGMILVAGLGQKPLNNWSYIFLVPALISAVADAMYSSSVVQGLAFAISLSSLTFFAFWLTIPKIDFSKVREFWPLMFIKETIWPLGSLAHVVSKMKGDRRLGGVAIGTILALPFLLLFAIAFSSADQLFAKSFSSIFQNADFWVYVSKTIRDLVVSNFFLASGTTMLTRLVDARKPAEPKEEPTTLNQTVFVTFLALINILFLVFVGFQFAYFFGGQAYLAAQGITYASYARQGFFQLLFVAGVVFGMTWVIYWMTNMRQRWTKILSIALIVETGIIIASALKRLLLYIDAYGLTLSRWWAAFCIILIGLTLLMVVVVALKQVAYAPAAKFAFLGVLIVISLMLLVPSEKMIARYNIDRFLSGEDFLANKKSSLDFGYLKSLSTDAASERVRLANAEWPADPTQDLYAWQTNPSSYIGQLKNSKESLKFRLSKIGLGASLSDYWALNALDSLK